jgi:hypothetical protein
MVSHAKSQKLHRQLQRKAKEDLEAEAVKLYFAEQEKEGEKRLSSRAICQKVSDDYYACKHVRITLSHHTLLRDTHGGKTLSQSNTENSWLTVNESKTIVDYAITMARWGFPLSLKRLKEHATKILQVRMGARFPEMGLGKNWATNFITHHYDQLGRYWSRALPSERGHAVNPVTKEEYFKLLKEMQGEYEIADELTYGADESGKQTGIVVKEYVVGLKGASVQHQEHSGN